MGRTSIWVMLALAIRDVLVFHLAVHRSFRHDLTSMGRQSEKGKQRGAVESEELGGSDTLL